MNDITTVISKKIYELGYAHGRAHGGYLVWSELASTHSLTVDFGCARIEVYKIAIRQTGPLYTIVQTSGSLNNVNFGTPTELRNANVVDILPEIIEKYRISAELEVRILEEINQFIEDWFDIAEAVNAESASIANAL